MERRPIWHAARMLAVGIALAGALSLLGGAFPGMGTPTAEAGVAQGKDDEKKDKKDRDRNQDDDEDHTLNGQVLEINTDKVNRPGFPGGSGV
jgi:hypothetical protein